MFRVLRVAGALGLFLGALGAQEDPLAWLPLRVGSRWVYELESKSGNRQSPHVERWTTEESITAAVVIPEGLVVLREVNRKSNAPEQRTARVLGLDGQVRDVQPGENGGYLVTRQREPYLVRGNCVYIIDNGFDRQSGQLREDYRKYLAEGAVSPDFCFPLEVGREWGNSDIPWRVEPASNDRLPSLPKYPGAVRIFSGHFGSGGLKDVWFQKGVGVVREYYTHNGSYDEYTKTLLSFSR